MALPIEAAVTLPATLGFCSVCVVKRLKIATHGLLALDRVKQGSNIAAAKPTRPFVLNKLKEERQPSGDRLHENLEQVTPLISICQQLFMALDEQ